MKKDYIVELREEEADELMDDHWVGELIRCKDCEYNPSNGAMAELLPYYLPCKSIPREDNYFCADGKHKEGGGME